MMREPYKAPRSTRSCPQERLRRAVAEAITRRALASPLTLAGPFDIEVDLSGPYMVDLATLVPGVSRAEGGRTITFTAADFADAYPSADLAGHGRHTACR